VTDEELIGLTIDEANLAPKHGDVPVGAVIVYKNKVIASAHNQREKNIDPTGHAEIIAIRDAAKKIGSWYLNECTLAVTLEPCSMCAGAVISSRIKRLVFGAYDNKSGACGSLYNLCNDSRLNHQVEVAGGIMAEECGKLLKNFFADLRNKNRKR